MIEYALVDIDDNEFNLNEEGVTVQPTQGSLTFLEDAFENDNRVVPNSALPGSVKLGLTRLMSKDIQVRFTRAYPLDTNFRTAENTFLEFLQRTVSLKDITNSLITPVAVSNYRVRYDPGGLKLSSDNEITLQLLDPFWKAITPDNEAGSLIVGTVTVPLTNSGFLETPPVITVTAAVALTKLQVYIDESQEGIQVDDTLFGTIGYTVLVIDCEAGELLLSGIDRTASILPATGYFNIPVGSSTLKFVSTAVATYDMDFNKRYYV